VEIKIKIFVPRFFSGKKSVNLCLSEFCSALFLICHLISINLLTFVGVFRSLLGRVFFFETFLEFSHIYLQEVSCP